MKGQSDSRVTEDQFLGALLGMAIGDALGVPLRNLSAEEVTVQYGEISGYVGVQPSDDGQGPVGQISDKTEVVLCIVESLTTNDGIFDAENINARLTFLVKSPSHETMSDRTNQGIETAAGSGGLVEAEGNDSAELAVATRGLPIGLMHAVGVFDLESLEDETKLATRLSHRGQAAWVLTKAAAMFVTAAARRPEDVLGWFDRYWRDRGSETVDELRSIATDVARAETYEDGVFRVVAQGGEPDAAGAIAGAIAGARFGASGIPQGLIDDLDARIYLTLAAPWFYRVALRRQGTIIDLRTAEW